MKTIAVTAAFIVSSLIMESPVHASKLTRSDRIAACELVRDLVPTEEGSGISLKKCLGFQFDLISETSEARVIQLLGQTVEDMATVCTVLLPLALQGPAEEPVCELE